MTRPNSVTTSYAYDTLSRLLSVLHRNGGGAVIDGASYTMDNVGNRTSKTNQLNAVTENYSYDAIYQLTQVLQGATTTESYTYDTVGNRLSSLGVSPYTYNNSNQLTSTPGLTYTYDNNGNMLTKVDASGTTTYAWDFENRLVSVTLPGSGGTVSFKYDPFGRRIQKSSASGTMNYAYDGADMAEEVDATGSAVARYAMGSGIDEPLAMLRGGVISYYQADSLGSITSLSSSSGSLAATYTYDSFGNPIQSSGSLVNPFRYTGREYDSETGVYYYRARYNDSTVGRFLSEDPLAWESDDINFYPYVANGPTNYGDPLGLCRILFNGDLISIETNNGSQKLGPFPASNKTCCGSREIGEGVSRFNPVKNPPQWQYRNGAETGLGRRQFDAKRNRHQAFGSALIPLDIPGRSYIYIHARYPDTKDLKKTKGCVRVHDPVASSMSQFIEVVCMDDEPNSFHYFKRPW